jgi:hypothetical protein
MRFFARIEVVADDAHDADDQPAIERVADNDLDIALFVRDTLNRALDEHGTAWEADIHFEPLRPRGDSE